MNDDWWWWLTMMWKWKGWWCSQKSPKNTCKAVFRFFAIGVLMERSSRFPTRATFPTKNSHRTIQFAFGTSRSTSKSVCYYWTPRGAPGNPTWRETSKTPRGFWKPHVGFWEPHVGFLKTPRGILKTPRGVFENPTWDFENPTWGFGGTFRHSTPSNNKCFATKQWTTKFFFE